MTTEAALLPYDVRDPALVLEEITKTVVLSENSVHLALIEHPATEQKILLVEELHSRPTGEDFSAARAELRAVVQSWPLADHGWPPRHTAVIVVARRGFCVVGPGDVAWLNAWHHGNFARPVYAAELMVVTEHGWTDFTTEFAGHTPALRT